MMTKPRKKKAPKSATSAIVDGLFGIMTKGLDMLNTLQQAARLARAAGIERETFVATVTTIAGTAWDMDLLPLQPEGAPAVADPCIYCGGNGMHSWLKDTKCGPCAGTGKKQPVA